MQVYRTFPDGTKLVTVHHPFSTDEGDLSLALYGSFLPIPSIDLFPAVDGALLDPLMGPGAMVVGSLQGEPAPSDIVLNAGRALTALHVTNDGDRPIQVTF